MAVAFYIPDQAVLLRKAQLQEKQILAKREAQWRYIVSVIYNVLRQYLDTVPNYLKPKK
ncbi:cell death protein rpr [Glossina fuscipes]|uniref:Cell death protein rpr n=2 Tax=Glossina TaxID=7393 RepID=A0A8U0W6T2_9MUSC|nr:cell death protein rpr [Glossina fuscipes]